MADKICKVVSRELCRAGPAGGTRQLIVCQGDDSSSGFGSNQPSSSGCYRCSCHSSSQRGARRHHFCCSSSPRSSHSHCSCLLALGTVFADEVVWSRTTPRSSMSVMNICSKLCLTEFLAQSFCWFPVPSLSRLRLCSLFHIG